MGAEGRDEGVLARGEEGEEQLLDLGVGGLGGVEVGADAEAAGEGGGGHVGAGEEVLLLDLGDVEEHGEALGVEHGDHAGVARHEGARRHVDADDGGAVLLDAGLEVLVLALEVVEVEAVADGRDERQAVAARHLPRHQGALVAARHAALVHLTLLLARLVGFGTLDLALSMQTRLERGGFVCVCVCSSFRLPLSRQEAKVTCPSPVSAFLRHSTQAGAAPSKRRVLTSEGEELDVLVESLSNGTGLGILSR